MSSSVGLILVQVASVTTTGCACMYSPAYQCSHLDIRRHPNAMASFPETAVCAGPRNFTLWVRLTLAAPAAHFSSPSQYTLFLSPPATTPLKSADQLWN